MPAGLLASGACDRALVLAVEMFEECADLYAARRSIDRPSPGGGRGVPLARARRAARSRLEPGPARRRNAARRRRLGETFAVGPSSRWMLASEPPREAHWNWPPAGAANRPGWPGPER